MNVNSNNTVVLEMSRKEYNDIRYVFQCLTEGRTIYDIGNVHELYGLLEDIEG